MPVAIVTDSTAYLPSEHASGVEVVPLTVALGGVAGVDGTEVDPARVAAALAERRVSVTTSRPSPERFAEIYRRLLADGASDVVSIHLSARLSGTYEAAGLAAAAADPVRVTVVDSGSTGMGLGFCVLAAMAAARAGGGLAQVVAAARSAAARTSAYFYVDTLEFLRRGGRIGAASALLGTALSVKPILHVAGGEIVVTDRVRTASRALHRLVDLAMAAARDSDVDVAVHHLAAVRRAQEVSEALAARLGSRLRHQWITEVGAVVAAHAGPGLVGVVVCRLLPQER